MRGLLSLMPHKFAQSTPGEGDECDTYYGREDFAILDMAAAPRIA
jgi:hypothetical protein